MDWEARRRWALEQHAQREATLAGEGEREDMRLAGIAGASWAAGLASLMLGDREGASALLRQAADEYDTSWRAAPPGSWGRPIAMLRCRLMASDADGAARDAEAALEAGVLDAPGPIGGYCAALALLVLGRDEDALPVAERIAAEGLDPVSVAHALAALARRDGTAYAVARAAVLRSFEERKAFLEDVPVADTVLVLEALARSRDVGVSRLTSTLLPA